MHRFTLYFPNLTGIFYTRDAIWTVRFVIGRPKVPAQHVVCVPRRRDGWEGSACRDLAAFRHFFLLGIYGVSRSNTCLSPAYGKTHVVCTFINKGIGIGTFVLLLYQSVPSYAAVQMFRRDPRITETHHVWFCSEFAVCTGEESC